MSAKIRQQTPELNTLFVYGIFLDESNRLRYGMSNPTYDTVPDYTTVGGYIVQAHKVTGARLALTGLVVTVEPRHWGRLDALEGGYHRTIIKTTNGVKAYMYVAPESD